MSFFFEKLAIFGPEVCNSVSVTFPRSWFQFDKTDLCYQWNPFQGAKTMSHRSRFPSYFEQVRTNLKIRQINKILKICNIFKIFHMLVWVSRIFLDMYYLFILFNIKILLIFVIILSLFGATKILEFADIFCPSRNCINSFFSLYWIRYCSFF